MHADARADAPCGRIRDTIEVCERNLVSTGDIRGPACGLASTLLEGTWQEADVHVTVTHYYVSLCYRMRLECSDDRGGSRACLWRGLDHRLDEIAQLIRQASTTGKN